MIRSGRARRSSSRVFWRFAGVDLTRIDGISSGAAQIVLTEVEQQRDG